LSHYLDEVQIEFQKLDVPDENLENSINSDMIQKVNSGTSNEERYLEIDQMIENLLTRIFSSKLIGERFIDSEINEFLNNFFHQIQLERKFSSQLSQSHLT
jgi:hypothetical protein